MKIWESFPRAYMVFLVSLICMTMTIDYLTGPDIHFPIFYLLPIGLAAWSGRSFLGYGLALTMPLIRPAFSVIQPEIWAGAELILNAFVRMAVFLFLTYLIDRTARQHRALQHEVRVLTGWLPICSFCKKIRNKADEWIQLERYISDHSEAQFSHGLCPTCLQQHYPDHDISHAPQIGITPRLETPGGTAAQNSCRNETRQTKTSKTHLHHR